MSRTVQVYRRTNKWSPSQLLTRKKENLTLNSGGITSLAIQEFLFISLKTKEKIRLSTRENVTSWLFMNFLRPGSPSRDPHGAALSRLSTNQHTLSPSKDSNFTERERVSNYMCPTLIVMSWFYSLIHITILRGKNIGVKISFSLFGNKPWYKY